MEDRYLFKAKRVDNGEWVTGSFITCEDGTCKIATSCLGGKADEPILVCAYDVDRDTICQCTGLKDKNGNLIWENDILNLDEGINAGCFWDEINFEWGVRTLTCTISLCCYSLAELAAIGNIFDNPELIKEIRAND